MKFSRHDPPYDAYQQWSSICSEMTWKKVSPDVLSGVVPASPLLNKAHSVLVMASASGNYSVFVANINRVDTAASAVDQEPYIAVFDHSASSASGGFVHHGSWRGRTTLPGKAFFDGISASGIQTYFPLSENPIGASGHLNELTIDSQNTAFWAAFSGLRGSTGRYGK